MHLRIGLVVLCLLNFSDLSGFFYIGIFIFVECEAHLLELVVALDVDLPSADSCSESYVLTFAADSKRQLLLRYYCSCRLLFFIYVNAFNDRRSQHVADENCRVLVPDDDIYFFAEELVRDVLDSCSSVSYACSYRINVRVMRVYGDLCAGSGFTGCSLDLYRSVSDLRDLELKQASDESRMRS